MNKLIKKQGSNICFGVIAVVLAVMPLLYSAGLMNSSTVLCDRSNGHRPDMGLYGNP